MRRSWPYYAILLAAAAVFLGIWLQRDRAGMVKAERLIEKNHAAHKAAHVGEYVSVWLPRAALVNLGCCALLLLAGPWLTRRGLTAEKKLAIDDDKGSGAAYKALWIGTAAAIISSAALNYPRLSQSLWGDEENTVRRAVVGEYLQDQEGRLHWIPVSWGQALWFYRDPNNHPCFSILAKFSHSFWPAAEDPSGSYFHESGVRLPAYLFGLAGLAMLAALAQTLRMPAAGLIAVIWLALHPWHVRYGVDARGYSLLFVWIPLSLLTLWKAQENGRWRWWILFGLSEFLILWSYPGALYFLVTLNAAALALLFQKSQAGRRGMQFGRWIVANAAGAMLTIQMLLPCVPPMLLYLRRDRIKGTLTSEWRLDTLSQLFTGRHFQTTGTNVLSLNWETAWRDQKWLVILTAFVVSGAFAAGVAAFWRKGGSHRRLLIALLLPAPLMVAVSVALGNILYSWYVMIGLPGLALVVGAGLSAMGAPFPARWRLAAASLGLLVFGLATWPMNSVLRKHSAEPSRECAAAMRPLRNPHTADLSGVMTIVLTMNTKAYDPAAREVKSLDHFHELLAEADHRGVPTFVHFEDWGLATQSFPQVMAELQNAERFEMLPPFRGLDTFSSRFAFRYKGPAATPKN